MTFSALLWHESHQALMESAATQGQAERGLNKTEKQQQADFTPKLLLSLELSKTTTGLFPLNLIQHHRALG